MERVAWIEIKNQNILTLKNPLAVMVNPQLLLLLLRWHNHKNESNCLPLIVAVGIWFSFFLLPFGILLCVCEWTLDVPRAAWMSIRHFQLLLPSIETLPISVCRTRKMRRPFTIVRPLQPKKKINIVFFFIVHQRVVPFANKWNASKRFYNTNESTFMSFYNAIEWH